MILGLLNRARALNQVEAEAAEVLKRGVYRVGTCGALPDGFDGSVGKCGRVAHLRTLGVQEPPDERALRIFEAGIASEETLVKKLRTVWPKVLTEDEYPISLDFGDGVLVTGRPDAVLIDPDGNPVRGVEHKNVVSMWKAIQVHYDLRPDPYHLVQASIYSHAVGVPWSLVYSSRSEFHLSTAPKWMQAKFKPGVYDVEFKGTEPFKISNFEREYFLEWRDGYLWYATEGGTPTKTELTWDSIVRYYKEVATVGQTKKLPARPSTRSLDGTKTYKQCDYCPWAEQCNQYENNYDTWLDHVTLKHKELVNDRQTPRP